MEILKLAISGWFARAMAAAARLGIADQLADGPLSTAELARRLDLDPGVLHRLLQMLTVPGVVERQPDGSFRLADAYDALRSDHPYTQRHFAMLAAGFYTDAFAGLEHTARTGESGFREVFGASLYEHLNARPELSELFDQGMVDLARPVAAELAERYDFTGVRTLVDVGGGSGGLLPGLLAARPELRGVVADRAEVCERGREVLSAIAAPDVLGRISFQPADFFAEVPAGGDRYVLKNVLHDWTYDNCVRILRVVGEAMRRTERTRPRLLVLEPLVETDLDGWRAMFQAIACDEGALGLDEEAMRGALAEAGFEVDEVARLATGHKLLDCALA
ncbi:methyltransferase [Saccharopolyspora sp. MS10]|uniref:methyltransferase n=1 Tax=Saccharopolyspora sp. MS10 TaxID=3385973 RepID=UPI0039A03DC8